MEQASKLEQQTPGERKAILEKNQKEFRETQEYQKYIEDMNKLPNALEKILFVVEDCFNTNMIQKKAEKYDYGIFTQFSIYWNEDIRNKIIDELKTTIQTPEELDKFLSDLFLKIHAYYNLHSDVFFEYCGMSPNEEDYSHYDGDVVIKIIGDVIFPAFAWNHSKTDLDWWYVLGHHLFFSTGCLGYVNQIYRHYPDDPQSVKWKEFILSKFNGNVGMLDV